MPRNSDEWMLGIHVTNQSVENGSIPLGGDLPRISLYSRRRRSRESIVSASSTCRRAPSSTSSLARRTSRASSTTLLLRMSGCLRHLAGHEDRRMHDTRRLLCAVLAVAGQQIPNHLIVEAELAHKHISGSELEDLSGRQRLQDVSDRLA